MVGGLALLNLSIALCVTDLVSAVANSRNWAVRLLPAPGKRSAERGPATVAVAVKIIFSKCSFLTEKRRSDFAFFLP